MIDSIKVFRMVVEKNGFRAASRALALSPAMVSRHIAKLEFSLKTQLLKRNGRTLLLTEQGRAFYQRSGQLVSLYEQCLHSVGYENDSATGHLKIGVPNSVNQLYLLPALHDFYQRYPGITLDIISGNHSLELFSHGFDLALHCGPLPDSSLYFTLIGYWRKYTVAAPDYLHQYGEPLTPYDLSGHQCLVHFDNRQRCWRYQVDGVDSDIAIQGRTRSNSSLDLCALARAGNGIAYLPDFTVKHALADGQLVSILDDYMPASLPMYIVHIAPEPSKRERAFIDFIKALDLASPSPFAKTHHL